MATAGSIEADLDVVIVGAGLSGIGAACRLRRDLPRASFVVLEARDAIGGTWDLFRYPGVRSDSDVYTLAYPFRPWTGEAVIADGPAIRDYITSTAREAGVDAALRTGRRVVAASWSTPDARWELDVELAGGERERYRCRLLYSGTGYYRYDRGHTPELPGIGRFAGPVVHPQAWPEDLDHAGKRVVVIGSGATAMSLVPALARSAAHVVMLQRSPTWVVSSPSRDPSAARLGRLPGGLGARVQRARYLLRNQAFYQLCTRAPARAAAMLRAGVVSALPVGYDVDTHFAPRYRPWEERMCLVPDGDLFAAIREGTVSVVTDRIETFTETGVRLLSGRELEADVVVTATGLEVQLLGGIALSVDGRPVEIAECVDYKGVMLAGVPNLALSFGYVNASWTLKSDLVARWVCRLLAEMDAGGWDQATPAAPGPQEPTEAWLPLRSGYVRRAEGLVPRQGTRAPWRRHHDYLRDLVLLRRSPTADPTLVLSRRPAPPRAVPPAPSRAVPGRRWARQRPSEPGDPRSGWPAGEHRRPTGPWHRPPVGDDRLGVPGGQRRLPPSGS